MDISIGQLLVWLIIGALAGTLAARLVTRRKRGYGFAHNLVLGLIGAVVGGLIFDLLDIRIGGDIVLTFSDLLAAFIGSVVVIAMWTFLRR